MCRLSRLTNSESHRRRCGTNNLKKKNPIKFQPILGLWIGNKLFRKCRLVMAVFNWSLIFEREREREICGFTLNFIWSCIQNNTTLGKLLPSSITPFPSPKCINFQHDGIIMGRGGGEGNLSNNHPSTRRLQEKHQREETLLLASEMISNGDTDELRNSRHRFNFNEVMDDKW